MFELKQTDKILRRGYISRTLKFLNNEWNIGICLHNVLESTFAKLGILKLNSTSVVSFVMCGFQPKRFLVYFSISKGKKPFVRMYIGQLFWSFLYLYFILVILSTYKLGKVYDLLKNRYLKPKCSIKCANKRIDYFDYQNGVRQGCVLSLLHVIQ